MRLLCIYASVSVSLAVAVAVSVSNNPSWRTKIHESALRCCLEKGASMSASASPASNVLRPLAAPVRYALSEQRLSTSPAPSLSLSSSPVVNVVHSLQVCLSWAAATAEALGFDSVSKTGRQARLANVRMSRLIGFLAVGLGGFLTWLLMPTQ